MAALLAFEPDIEVVGEVGRGDEVAAAVSASAPDVVLLDIEMPGKDGLEVAGELTDCKVIIVTTFGRPGYLERAVDAGVAGFVVKDARAEELADAIRKVHAGGRVVNRKLAAASRNDRSNPLTSRERDLLRRVLAEGGTIADLAGGLHLSPATVRNYLSGAIGKTGARNRAEAAHIAESKGWL